MGNNIKKGEFLYEIALGLVNENESFQATRVLENNLKRWVLRFASLKAFVTTINDELFVIDKYKFIDELHSLRKRKLVTSKFI